MLGLLISAEFGSQNQKIASNTFFNLLVDVTNTSALNSLRRAVRSTLYRGHPAM
jgi:hypothetical protein